MKIKRTKALLPWFLAAGFALLYLSMLVAPQKEQQESEPQKFETAADETSPSGSLESESQGLALVTRVVDGDTIEVAGATRVRYIGVDTPEPGECFGNEAMQANAQLVASKRVRLETDIQTHDRYGRLLAYIWLDSLLVNEQLVRQGTATVTTYAPNVKYTDRFLAAQQEARDTKRGLWSENPCPTSPATTSSAEQVQGAKEGCEIKGNISSSGEKIYHMPSQRYWERTKIDEGKGERWFCTEEEARNAGWRKSKL